MKRAPNHNLRGEVALEPILVTARQVAELLQISVRTVWRMDSTGQLPKPIRVGGIVRWPLDQINDWVSTGLPATAMRSSSEDQRANATDVQLRTAARRIARKCRHVIQGCLREEEWHDADNEFFRIIFQEINNL